MGTHPSNAGGACSVPGWGNRILHAMKCNQKKSVQHLRVLGTKSALDETPLLFQGWITQYYLLLQIR